MNYSDSLSDAFRHPFIEKLGWTLLHFVWQGVVVAIVFWIVLVMMRRASANARYLVACGGLLVMAVLPSITLAILPSQEVETTGAVKKWSNLDRPDDSLRNTANAAGEDLFVGNELAPVDATVLSEDAIDIAPISDANPSAAAAPALSLRTRCEVFLRPWLSWMILIWIIGVFVLAVRLLLTWTQVQRLRTHGVMAAGNERTELMQKLTARLGVRQVVRLLESSLVEVPTVIGWLKPVILLPIASVNALTVSQIEAILAHELAHIRRADYAVNLLQGLIETLLFYHPAVWWISARIRQEREHCCDDVATSIGGDTAGYVMALVRMEELRCEPQGVALAARGGHLLSRVRRLLMPPVPDRLSPWWLTGAAALMVVGGLIGLPVLSSIHAGLTVDAASLADLDNITPSQIADRIEDAWKRYESIEYTATVEETRNTDSFASDDKPMFVKGTGGLLFRTDGTRWFADEKSFLYRQGTTDTYPTQKTSAFDGERHAVFDGRGLTLTLVQDEFAPSRLAASGFFWQAGLSADWLIGALRRPEAKLIGRIEIAETSCLHVVVKLKPEWDTEDHSFDIMISPEQGWLPLRVTIERGGEMQAEWSISKVEMTDSGLTYPVEFETKHPDTDTTPLRRVTIESFRERADFTPEEFVIPTRIGTNIVDHRQGFAWHSDPWWDELQPWMRENIDWPQPDLRPLHELSSDSEPKLAGQEAPTVIAGKWLTEPAPLDWDRPQRKVTVLHFFNGLLIEPNPRQLKALDHLQQRYRDGGLEVIGIASHDNFREQVGQTVKELELSFPVMIDNKANAADSASKSTGAAWGATFVTYRLRANAGTVVIDGSGKVLFVDRNTSNLPDGMSHVETLVRDALVGANGTPDPPRLRQRLVNYECQLRRGTAATPAELSTAVTDQSPVWQQNALQAIANSAPQAQQSFLRSPGRTMHLLNQFNDNQARLPWAMFDRVEDEWKRRASLIKGNGLIRGAIRMDNDGELVGCKAIVVVQPELKLLMSNSPGAYMSGMDKSRVRKIDTDDSGAFTIDKLPKGTYQVTIAAPGKPRVMRTIQLDTHDSLAELSIDLSGGDTISGKITNAAGEVISNATVKAMKRFLSAESAALDFYTTEHLPQEPTTTNASGDFYFESLFEGAYVFEISFEGYENETTKPIPAGASEMQVILTPEAQL